jgi:hypothetical protein
VTGPSVFVGGYFTSLGDRSQYYLAAMGTTSVGVPWPGRLPLTLAPSRPNPARGSTLLRFTLPIGATVTLELFDLQGRRVATVLDDEYCASGPHERPFRADQVESGLYFVRLSALGTTASRKMLVLR